MSVAHCFIWAYYWKIFTMHSWPWHLLFQINSRVLWMLSKLLSWKCRYLTTSGPQCKWGEVGRVCCYVSIKSVCGGGWGHLYVRRREPAWLYSLLALAITVGLCSRILKLPELFKVPLESNLMFFIASSGDTKPFIPRDHKMSSWSELSSLHNKQAA